MNRRQYLSAVAGAGIAGLGGCLSVFDSEVQLAGLAAANYADEPKTLDVRVHEGDAEHVAVELELGAGEDGIPDRAPIDCEWPESGQFVVEATDGQAELTVDLAEHDLDCLVGVVTVDLLSGMGDGLSWSERPCEDIGDSEDPPVEFCEFAER